MGLDTVLAIVPIFPIIGTLLPWALVLIVLLVVLSLLRRVRRRGTRSPAGSAVARARVPKRPLGNITLRQFTSMLSIVAILAILFSPSTLGFSLGNQGITESATSPFNTSQTGTSLFLNFLSQSGYHAVVANNTQELSAELPPTHGAQIGQPVTITVNRAKPVLVIIGADIQLTQYEREIVREKYLSGNLSLLIAEGYTTNRALLETLFKANVTGADIVEPNSPFKDSQGKAFPVIVQFGPTSVSGVLDIASPILLNSTALTPVATSSSASNDSFNSTRGARTVVAAGSNGNGSRAIVISDSAPFTNYIFNRAYPKLGVNETSFVTALVNWVTQSDKNATIILDNAHYLRPLQISPFGFGLRIGPLFALFLQFYLSSTANYYQGFLTGLEPWERVLMALLTAWGVYGLLAAKYAVDRRGKDDQPLPSFEKSIVAESQARLDFLKTSRTKGFYVATSAQLHDVLDLIVQQEFGTGMSSLPLDQLVTRLGKEKGRKAARLFARLGKISQYANGKRRWLLPPVLRWKTTLSKLTRQAEDTLNELGLTIAGAGEAKGRVEYRLRRGT